MLSTALRESVSEVEGKYREVQSKCAAEVAAASVDRLRLTEVLPKVEGLTCLNHKLAAALAVSQLQAAVGVQGLLSQVVPRCGFELCIADTLLQAGLSSLSIKTPQQQAVFLLNAKVFSACSLFVFIISVGAVMLLLSHNFLSQSLLQTVREENVKLGVAATTGLSSALDSAVTITNQQ